MPTGIFFSPQHAWARIETNGAVLVGPDDLLRKAFDRVEGVELPHEGQLISKGEALFSLRYGDYALAVPSPVSGSVMAVNAEHAEHPEWLAIKPFELSWMCAIEPSDLSGELPGMKIGQDSVAWYRQEIDRFHELAATFTAAAPQEGDADTQLSATDYVALLQGFAKPFQDAG